MTGAPFPAGADAIAIVEITRTDGDDGPGRRSRPSAGAARPAGGRGHRRRPGGLPGRHGARPRAPRRAGQRRAGNGSTVWPAPVVGVLSTGDELVDGRRRAAARARSATPTATPCSACCARTVSRPSTSGSPADDEADIRGRHRAGPGRCDALLTSGGVSMGDFDYVKKVLDEHRATWTGCRWPSARPSRSPSAWSAARRCSACPATRCRPWSATSCSPGRPCAG